MSTRKREGLKPVYDPKDIPEGLSDEEEFRFWETHSITEEFLRKTEEVPENERPRPRNRTRPINVRFDDFTLRRLKALADRRNVGYQTLLKEFVMERLYEEEKRERSLPKI
jgi:predicted DNA binding CopG/RHH family protein